MQEWKTDLKLTDDQVDQIKDILKASRGAHKDEAREHFGHGKAMLDAFAGDTFVADQGMPAKDPKAAASEHADRVVSVLQQILPLLTPEQRSLAAAKIRARVQSGDGEALPPL